MNDWITLWTDASPGLVTLILLAATVAAAILCEVVAKEILAIPVATLFAFTSLRGTLPGAPTGFGKRQASNFVTAAVSQARSALEYQVPLLILWEFSHALQS